MAPATAVAKKSEEKSDHQSSSEDSDEEELKEPQPKKRKRYKQAPRKSVAKGGRPNRRSNANVSYEGQC